VRGAATEVNRFDRLSLQIFFPHLQLLAQRMDIATFQFAAGGGVEIAIDAACLAKRKGFRAVYSPREEETALNDLSLDLYTLNNASYLCIRYKGKRLYLFKLN
jgi:hypothetical protein